MFRCMTIGTYQHIFIRNSQPLGGHGRTDRLFTTLCIQKCSRIFQTRNDISSVFLLFLSVLKRKCDQVFLLGKHLYLPSQRINRRILVGYQIFGRRFRPASVYKSISPESQPQCQYHHQYLYCQPPDLFFRLFIHLLLKSDGVRRIKDSASLHGSAPDNGSAVYQDEPAVIPA